MAGDVCRGDNRSFLGYLSEMDQWDDEIDALREACKAQCEAPQERLREILETVENDGVDMAAFKNALRDHRYERRRLKRLAKMGRETADAYEHMVDAMADFATTPLGQAASKPMVIATIEPLSA